MGDPSQIASARRNGILKVLWSDERIAHVDPATTPARLERGDEFVDLQQLDKGVQYAHGITAPMGGMLPRKAVQAHTWSQIVGQL